MHSRVTLGLLLMVLPFNVAAADTIHLKNGRSIVADHVRENGNHYEYEIGDDSYAIAKSTVDHVDVGGALVNSGSGGGSSNAERRLGDLPTLAPSSSLAGEGNL